MRRFARLGVALALLLALATTGAAQNAPDVPSGDGTIRGTVVAAESGAPMPDVEVALYALSSDGVPGLRRTRSDASGRFDFAGISRAPNLAYLVGARYRDVPYPGSRITFGGDQEVSGVEIRISGLSDATDDLVPATAELRLERAAGGLRAVQTLRVENRGQRTFFVEAEARTNRQPALRARLPEGATDFQMPLGVIPEGVVRDGRDLLWWGPVHPGTQDLSFSYAVGAADATEVPTSWELPSGAGSLRLWVPSGATLEPVPGLREADLPPTAGAPGFRAYEGDSVPAGHRMALRLELPAAKLAPGAGRPVEVRALLTVDDASLAVTETHTLDIAGGERVLGTAAEPLYRIELPEGLSRLRFGSSGNGILLQPDDGGGLLVLGEAEPGELQIELAYQLATRGFPALFARSFPQQVPLVSIFVADTGTLAPRSERLHRRRPVRTADLTYIHLEAFEVGAGETVKLELDRQPLRARPPVWLMRGSLALGGLVILALLAGPLWSDTRGVWIEEESESAAERERQGVLAALRDLDHDFETGKIETADYETLRRDLRAQALTLMAQVRDGVAEEASTAPEPVGDPSPAARFCTACGTAAAAGHRFCAHCGEALGERDSDGDAA